MNLWILFLNIVLYISVEGQLFLGPCGKPPSNRVLNLDLEKYTGLWHASLTTLNELDSKPPNTVSYELHKENNSLSFKSGETSGKLQKKNLKYAGELRLKFDNLPRVYHFYVLATNYDSVAVEYTCLDGVFKKTETIKVLTRDHYQGNPNILLKKYNLDQVIPENLLPKLKAIN